MDDSSAGESALCVATSTGAQHADEVRKCDTSFQQPNISVLWGPGLEGTDIICKDSECACIRQFTLKLQGKIGSFLILESPENSVMVETDKISILTTMVEYLHTLSKKEDECADPETLVFVTGTIKATAFYGAIIQQLPESNTNNPAASSPRLDVMLDGLGDYTCEVSSVKLSKQYYACTDRSVLPKPPMHTLFVQFLVIKVRDQHPMPPREVMGSSTTRSKPRDSDPTYLRLATAVRGIDARAYDALTNLLPLPPTPTFVNRQTSDFVKPLLEYILANAPSATAAAASDADVEALFEGRIPTDLSSAALQQQLERCSPDIVVEAVGCYHVGRLGHNKET
ncbi:hypothetical protein C8Q79DRAFT_1014696 [Trametes meyenii]|nr:hypothetical protein C8Q79DRAFT_1014696 [Trametes meyenii]